MDQPQLAGGIRTTPGGQQTPAPPDDSSIWMGGEATVGAQAKRHLRRVGGRGFGPALALLGLAFLGGLAAGSLVCSLSRRGSR